MSSAGAPTLDSPAAGRILERLAPATAAVRRCRILGTQALLAFELDTAEHERRRNSGAAAATDIGFLDLLLGLPLGQPVDRAALVAREQRALAKAPPGFVEVGRTSVTRRARPPLTVSLAVVSAGGWRQGLERAGRFAPFCSRALLLDRPPRDLGGACAEADYYGVGLLVGGTDGSAIETLVRPEVFRRARTVARTWWFTEETYRAYLTDPLAGPRPAREAGRG